MTSPADVEQFTELRPLLFAIAYRMLGSAADADDILQDAYIRWAQRGPAEVSSPRGFLTTTVVRLCLDELKSARKRRERYVGPWLPEPLLVDDHDGAAAAEMADSLSMAFLVLLEELAPHERAGLLLHDVFGYGYDEVAGMLGRTEPAARQLVRRARQRVGERRRRFDADREQSERLAERFLEACSTGDIQGLMAMLAEDVVVWTDGGGKAKAAPNPIYGAAKSARFLAAIAATIPAGAEVRTSRVNGQPGLVISDSTAVHGVIALDVIDGQIVGVRAVVNPEKLGHVPTG
ncbi:MAG TPA: RNA polymerase sigma-70 factor [Mycobacteriales bacterium]|nr:RNA polymerase sigma-70 factor [Mycobacteriales bacterium]